MPRTLSNSQVSSILDELEGYINEARIITIVFSSKKPEVIYNPTTRLLAIHLPESYKTPYFKRGLQEAIQCLKITKSSTSFIINTIIAVVLSLVSLIFTANSSFTSMLIFFIILGAAYLLSRLRKSCRQGHEIIYADIPLLEELVSTAASILRNCERISVCSGSLDFHGATLTYKARYRFIGPIKPRVVFTRYLDKVQSTFVRRRS